MDLTKLIQETVKKNQVIIGYNRVMKAIKTSNPKLIVMANNIPREKRERIEHNAKITKINVEIYPNDSTNLGLVCGKPFAISTLAIKGSEK
jgi:large subunit ribosomal protein L30e